MNNQKIFTYILCFNPLDQSININSINRYLHDSVDIYGFWNHIPFVYFVKSPFFSPTLVEKLQSFFPSGGFIVAEVDQNNMTGMLPHGAWDWFYADHSEKRSTGWGGRTVLPVPPPPAPRIK
tara:strand:+ start:549 stop:914 length:366 start_codon:yes stop_codon:yes gene_type:complete